MLLENDPAIAGVLGRVATVRSISRDIPAQGPSRDPRRVVPIGLIILVQIPDLVGIYQQRELGPNCF